MATAGARSIEDLVENAWVSVLTANATITADSIPVRHWKDASNDKIYPVVVVHCSPSANEGWDNNAQEDHFEAIVELGAQTENRADKDGAIVTGYLAAIRDTLAGTLATLLSNLSAVGNVTFNGIEVQPGVNDMDADNVNQKSTTVVCHVNYST